MTTRELGVWTADDCALLLIDHQKEMFGVIRSETSADLVELNASNLNVNLTLRASSYN